MSCSYCHFVVSATAYKYMSVSIGQMISLQYALDDDATNANDPVYFDLSTVLYLELRCCVIMFTIASVNCSDDPIAICNIPRKYDFSFSLRTLLVDDGTTIGMTQKIFDLSMTVQQPTRAIMTGAL